MKCPKCGKEFSEKPAISRRNQSNICPLCGQREALEDAVSAGAMSPEIAKSTYEALKEAENKEV